MKVSEKVIQIKEVFIIFYVVISSCKINYSSYLFKFWERVVGFFSFCSLIFISAGIKMYVS